MTSQVKTDARFAMIPEWLLDHAEISHAAVRLYCVLDRYADAQGHAYPGRKLLAERLGVKSADTVDRALKELVAVGAVSVSRRFNDAGDPTSNLYTVHRYPPEGVAARMRPPSRTGQETSPQESGDGGRTDAAQNENHLNQIPPTPAADVSSTPTCSRHPAGDGTNCRACGTTSRQLAEARAKEAAATKAAARLAEQQRIREEHAQVRALPRSPAAAAAVDEVRQRLAGAR